LAILVDCAVFRTFLDFTGVWARWSLESVFLKVVHRRGLFDAMGENPNFLLSDSPYLQAMALNTSELLPK